MEAFGLFPRPILLMLLPTHNNPPSYQLITLVHDSRGRLKGFPDKKTP